MGLNAEVLEADAESLPFGPESFDVYWSNGVLHHVPDIAVALHEAHRVLKPGGELWVAVYHRYSVFVAWTVFLWSWLLRGRFLRESFASRLSAIEHTTADARPIVNVYSRGEVQRLLQRSGFRTDHLWVRKLAREDVAHLPRFVPTRLLRWLEPRFGWYVIARAHRA